MLWAVVLIEYVRVFSALLLLKDRLSGWFFSQLMRGEGFSSICDSKTSRSFFPLLSSAASGAWLQRDVLHHSFFQHQALLIIWWNKVACGWFLSLHNNPPLYQCYVFLPITWLILSVFICQAGTFCTDLNRNGLKRVECSLIPFPVSSCVFNISLFLQCRPLNSTPSPSPTWVNVWASMTCWPGLRSANWSQLESKSTKCIESLSQRQVNALIHRLIGMLINSLLCI